MDGLRIDFRSLTTEDLQEEYAILHGRYQELRQAADTDAQRIHELTRNLKTAHASADYLSQELEALTLATNSQTSPNGKAHEEQEEQLRRLGSRYATLQQDYDTLMEENVQLRSDLEAAAAANKEAQALAAAATTPEATLPNEQCIERLNQLEQENLELMQQLDAFQVSNTMNIAQREKNIEILRDQVNCLEENLRSKRDELEERTQLLESTQEQLAEANAKVAMLTTAPENDARKGNSLFAEVDDQRQAMKQLLAAQKKSYLQMKRIYNESEHEIRRLKRENIAMHTELQACTSIFCNADKSYQDKLKERIRYLLNQNEDYERKLSWTQARLKELSSEKGIQWLDSMLKFCKKETDDLKQQLHSVRIQNASLEEQLRNVKQDMARWRFESLKSRCILFDRENLLEEHKIAFKSVRDLEYRITQTEQEAAKPRIMIADGTPKKLVPTSSSDEAKPKASIESPQTIIETKPSVEVLTTIKTAFTIPEENKENSEQSHIESLVSPPMESLAKSVLATKLFPPTPLRTTNTGRQKSPNSPFLKVKSFAFESPQHPDSSVATSQGRSILTKTRDIFNSKETQKNVHFSTDKTTTALPLETITIEDKDPAPSVEPVKITTIKEKRTKSNVIVRRVVVVSSKKQIK